MTSSEYRVRLEIFEGPLDLLLHLIRTQEIDIYDIPIARITEQYLEYLELMRDLNITLAGEFLVMAATLIHIKSRMLLPADSCGGETEEPEDPRTELVERLLEHERFKTAAGLLHDRHVVAESSWVRGAREFEEEEQEAVSATLFDLVRAFHRVVERYRRNIVLEVQREEVTLEEKMRELRELLSLKRELLFSYFLQRPIPRLHLVLFFFALLEMARLREVRLQQTSMFDDIRIVAC
ncbi:MAG TPA: segregation/condensation protein A [Acidobacteriota bacterium]|nr:segregation/condensation protein A [Acidobacteriota bacterium]HRR25855.1 segregation/condensation protein A [Acidobacteriota bacterium]HRR56649.1 segregation/condensation protein A [Acidobacteriota bacterium]HRV08938.1 segregation/condensation protein A [Acidobacteriota bacterium]